MTKPGFEAEADTLKALAHPVRLAILDTLIDTERSVGEIEIVSGIGQPALSQQLAVLRNAALVLTRREAKLVFYRINPTKFTAIRALLNGLMGSDEPDTASLQPTATHRRSGTAMFARILEPEA